MKEFEDHTIPRNSLGWPTITPEQMTEQQLRNEGEKWRQHIVNWDDYPGPQGTVCWAEWEQYAKELHKRGFIEVVDYRVTLQYPISTTEAFRIYSGLDPQVWDRIKNLAEEIDATDPPRMKWWEFLYCSAIAGIVGAILIVIVDRIFP